MTESEQLLAEYAKNGSETAFQGLVQRYINFVYSTALRLVGGNAHLAQDVTQIVFVGLARKGRSMPREVMLGGWLHQYTFHTATKAMRSERRRQHSESEAMEMKNLSDGTEGGLRDAAPLLDEAITQLSTEDRTAILLRFFEQCDFRTVGEALGSNEDAARMRVNRALEKLHAILKRRGVTLSVAALGTALAAEAVTAAPAGLATTIAGTAIAGAAAGGGTVAFLKFMGMTKLQMGIVGAALVAGTVAPLAIQHQARQDIRARDEQIRQQADQLDALRGENTRLSNRIAQAADTQTLSRQQLNDLLQLRNEVGQLKTQLSEAAKVQKQTPAVTTVVAAPEPDERHQALARLQAITKMINSRDWVMAFMKYAQQNQGQMPANFDAAAPYLPESGKDTMLLATNEFEIVYQGPLNAIPDPSETIVLREIVDPGATLKAYAFADGHSQIHKAADGNFQPWEAEHMIPPPAQ